MAIDAGAALRDGANDLANIRGLTLYVLFTIFAVATLPVHQTLTSEMYEWFVEVAQVSPEDIVVPATPLALDISIPVLAAGLAVVFLGAEALRLVAIRTIASDSPRAIPVDDITRRLVPTAAVLLVTSLVVQVAVYGGLAVFIIPGLIAAVLTIFVRQAVLLDDAGILEAFRTSISIVTDDVLQVLALLVALIVLSIAVGTPTMVLDPQSLASPIASGILGSVVTVYGIAVITRAYQQATSGDEEAEPLGPDDLDEESSEQEPAV